MIRAIPWIAIIAIIAIVQVVRAEYFRLRSCSASPPPYFGIDAAVAGPKVRARRPPFWAVLAGAVLTGGILVFAPRHGMCRRDRCRSRSGSPRSRSPGRTRCATTGPRMRRRTVTRAAIAWAVVAITTCLLELGSFLLRRETAQTKYMHPALSDLFDPMLDTWPGTGRLRRALAGARRAAALPRPSAERRLVIRTVTIAGYLLCAAAAIALVVMSHVPRAPLATFTELLDRILAERATRIALIVFWWWLGWHFLVARTVDPPLVGALLG